MSDASQGPPGPIDPLRITEIRVSPRTESALRAFVSVTFNNTVVVRGIKVLDGRDGPFISMPSRARPDGSFQEVVQPLDATLRAELERLVLDAYDRVAKGSEGGVGAAARLRPAPPELSGADAREAPRRAPRDDRPDPPSVRP